MRVWVRRLVLDRKLPAAGIGIQAQVPKGAAGAMGESFDIYVCVSLISAVPIVFLRVRNALACVPSRWRSGLRDDCRSCGRSDEGRQNGAEWDREELLVHGCFRLGTWETKQVNTGSMLPLPALFCQ
jgi:hypothetical protein